MTCTCECHCPPAIIKLDAEYTPEMLEELAARWKTAWERDKNKPHMILTDPPGTDAAVIRDAAARIERRKGARKGFVVDVLIGVLRKHADALEAKDRAVAE